MKRKASLEDLAKHCVPEDKGGITLSPVLQSGNSYVDVFPLPKKTGHLPLPLHLPWSLAYDEGKTNCRVI